MLSKILKKLRENCGFTQQQVADTLNIDRSTYAYYETGKTTPDINTIIKLAKIFNVSYTEIFEDEDRKSHSRVSDVSFGDEDILLKYGRKNSHQIYELTREEQKVIMGYRLLPKEKQDKILQEIYTQTKSLSKKNNS